MKFLKGTGKEVLRGAQRDLVECDGRLSSLPY
jgi:hypothetical protein